jgi:acetyltransferase-like isoleucine patch superfamily enzyme
MSRLTKQIATAVLSPVAQVCNRLDALSRLWAYARLRIALGGRLDPSVVVLGMPELHGTANLWLGKGLYLYRELYLETQGQGRIEIGSGAVLSRGVHIVSYDAVVLGEGVMVGEYSSLRDANHRVTAGQSVRNTGHQAKPIRIGKHAWIGRGVAILPGVTIGEGAVVGANAVVTQDVAAGDVVAGVPARTIRRPPA